ncbi:MAG: 3-oxoacyl-[acyl-carrier-protein] synthase III C-terminal domain-containing protein [Candidatus Bathyarchaeia archaeon]
MRDKVGIVGYGVYIPMERIATEKIVRNREGRRKDLDDLLAKIRDGLLLRYKSVANHSEDATTIAAESAENAIRMAGIDPRLIRSVALGTESKPYAVGLAARHVASFTGIGENVFVADLEGACNAGMQAMNYVMSQIKSGVVDYGLAVGTDVSQAPIRDALEYSAGAGAASFVMGSDDLVATIEDMAPCSTVSLDFWRRDEMLVPKHFGRTTVDVYIYHVVGAMEELLRRHPDLKISDFEHITFHQPSGYMPLKVCKALAQPSIEVGCDPNVRDRLRISHEDIEKKVKPWLTVLETGNTYAASTPIAIATILDKAKPGDDILAVSYGSGAYTIATWLHVEESITRKVNRVRGVQDYVNRRREIEFKTYAAYLDERTRRGKKRLRYPRIVAEVEPIGEEFTEIVTCGGCNRLYYPVRSRCLQYDCTGPLERLKLPKRAILKRLKPLPPSRRDVFSCDVLREGGVFIVDAGVDELRPGTELEAVTRRLDYEGSDGLILYGPCYRPLFRDY